MSCKNCFNGCVETTSDKCIKYTGLDIIELGISSGDSLSYVESAITTYLLKALDGTGIIMEINPGIICNLVKNYLPVSGDVTLVNYIEALIQTTCNLDGRVSSNSSLINGINDNFVLDCITGTTAGAGVHAVVQAVIEYLCAFKLEFNTFVLNVNSNFVKIVDIDTYIQNYIDNTPEAVASTLVRDRMVPNTIVEYYGSLSFFDGRGAGTGDWSGVFLCNGQNSTPDKRGRIPVGVTTGMGGGAMSSVVDPAVPGNPAYTILGTNGENLVTQTVAQMPAHSHTASFAGDPHTHTYDRVEVATKGEAKSDAYNRVQQDLTSDTTDSTVATGTIIVNVTGGGEGL